MTQNRNVPDHTHDKPASGRNFGSLQPGDTIAWPGVGQQAFVQYNDPATGGVIGGAAALSHNHPLNGEPGRNATAALPRPPYRAVNFIIKAG